MNFVEELEGEESLSPSLELFQELQFGVLTRQQRLVRGSALQARREPHLRRKKVV